MTSEPTNAAIESLLQHASWLDDLARRLVSDGHDADEIVQDTWIAALTHPPRHTTQLRGWLARVAWNVAVQRGRSERARKKRENTTARAEASTADSDALDRARTLRRLVDAVLALDEPYRSTLVLHYFERMSIADVAARQSVPESTVRTRMSRAIGILRERFRHEGGDSWSLAFATLVSKHAAHPHVVTSTAALGTSGALIGGIAMATAWKVGASVAAVIVLGWALWPKHDDSIARGLDVDRGPEKHAESLSTAGSEPAPRVPLASKPAVEAVDSPNSTAPKPDRASLDVHVKWGDDDTPAAGIVVSLIQFGAPDPKHDRPVRTTDADGSAHFDDIFPGSTLVRPDRCEGKLVNLDTGKRAVCDLVIPDGIDVDVRVVDENAAVVPRARIWVSDGSSYDGRVIGIADGSGRFRVRDVGPGRTMAALREDYGPSSQTRVEKQAPGSRVDLELVLSTAVGRLHGTVRDKNGAPIAGAAVDMSNFDRNNAAKPRHGETGASPTACTFTDASGAFEESDVGEGNVIVAVSARGFATLNLRIYATPVGESLDLRMEVQSVVHGVLRNERGEPLPKVRVSYTDSFWGVLNDTSSGADGVYRLECLPPGAVELYVDAAKSGEARRKFDLKAGDDVTWDVTVLPTPNVTGRVVDEAGKPLAGWSVNAVNPDPPESGLRKSHALRSAQTDGKGAFVIDNWPMDAVAIQVCEPSKPVDLLAKQVDAVKGGDHDLVISVASDDMHTASIRGRVVDENGRPLADTRIEWHRRGVNMYMPVKCDADGRFVAASLQPGTYEIDVLPEGLPALKSSDLKLVRDQNLDLGELRVSGAGGLKVRLHLPAGMDPDHGSPSLVLLEHGASIGLGVHLNGDVGTLDGIAPGNYVLRLFNPWLRAPVTDVKIELHRTTEVDVTAELATSRAVKFVVPDDKSYDVLTLRAIDAAGKVVSSSEFPFKLKSGLATGLTVGTYTIEATTNTGLSAKETLKVDSLEVPQVLIELHLR